jgi:hypothetical protein
MSGMGPKVTVKDVNFGIDEKVSNRPKADLETVSKSAFINGRSRGKKQTSGSFISPDRGNFI